MTREEATFFLANMDRRYMEDGMSEALDMAIKALEQLSSYEQTINKLTDAISKQEPKTGHWIDKHFDIATCSECGFKGGNYHVFNYCPNCGADMRGEEK